MAKIFVAIPVHRNIEHRTYQDFLETVRGSEHKIAHFLRFGDGLISRVRNEIGQMFLEKDYDYLMFIDDDITWRAEEKPIDRLVSRGQDIVAGIYPVRDSTLRPAIRTVRQQWVLENEGTFEKAVWPEGSVFRTKYVSTGFMLISRKCFEAVSKAHPFPFAPMPGITAKGKDKPEYLSEDWAFCQRASDMGYTIWADSSFTLGHIGQCIYTLTGVKSIDQVL